MVHDTLNYWASGLCPSSRIIKLENTTFRELNLFPSSGEGSLLERANLNQLRLALSKGPTE
jgi:hypothetical protein